MLTRIINYLCIIIIGLFIISSCFAISDSNLPYKEGELLVRFAPKTNGKQKTTTERNQVLSSFNAGTVKHSVKLVPGLSLVKLPENFKVKDALSELKGKNEFLYIEPNYKIKLLSTIPNDTYFDEWLWAMNNTGHWGVGTPDADIDAPEAWDIITDSDVIVAVIDTGVDYNHPDLAANMWRNPAEANGIAGVDDDNNGYIDDIYGYDFCTYDDGQDDPDPMDDEGHGTHCAGIIGAVGNNGIGVTGVCWGVNIMALKFISNSGWGWCSDAIRAIDYATDMGAKVLNNSWRVYEGWEGFEPVSLYEAVEAANACGVLFVAAAGNEEYNNDSSRPAYPASYDCNNIISVLATNHYDEMASYSNYGPNSVDLGAPGGELLVDGGIFSTIPGESYSIKDGTSMAAPHVAGACALVWAAHPNLTHLQVKQAILDSVDDLNSLQGLCVTGGRLNLYNAITYSPWPTVITLTKTDDVDNCVLPSRESLDSFINYTICYDANGFSDTNVILIDYLSGDVDFNSASGDYDYDPCSKTVSWVINSFNADSNGCFTLQVKVKSTAPQGQYITNTAELTSSHFVTQASEQTKICLYNVVYVDKDADEDGNGSSWQDAYTDLQTALVNVRDGNHPYAEQIFVAAGTYTPANQYASFEMLDGIDIYGHFAGWESGIGQRNLADGNNETILSGDIGDNNTSDVCEVVIALSAGARLDGFTIEKSQADGIFCSGGVTTIANCIIKNNYTGIYCDSDAYITITNTFVNNNSDIGIFCNDINTINIDHCTIGPDNDYGLFASFSIINAKNSIFNMNKNTGIYASDSNLTIEKCDVSYNFDLDGIGCADTYADIQKCTIQHNGAVGLYLMGNSNVEVKSNIIFENMPGIGLSANIHAEIRNNTIVYNVWYGIEGHGDGYEDINVVDNILWGNDINSLGGSFTKVNYNCIQGGWGSGIGNINVDPCFMDANITNYNYHLKNDSPCIDKGDPNFNSSTETDIDGEDRIKDGNSDGSVIVDMGADEYYYSPADIAPNPIDGMVNFLDFAAMGRDWQNGTDIYDLVLLCEDWLWIAGWNLEPDIGGKGAYFADNSGGGEMEMMMSMESEQEFLSESMGLQAKQAVDVNGLVDWLDELWLTDKDISDSISEEDWQEFIKSVKDSE